MNARNNLKSVKENNTPEVNLNDINKLYLETLRKKDYEKVSYQISCKVRE